MGELLFKGSIVLCKSEHLAPSMEPFRNRLILPSVLFLEPALLGRSWEHSALQAPARHTLRWRFNCSCAAKVETFLACISDANMSFGQQVRPLGLMDVLSVVESVDR